jgi:hypothetical protein
MNSDHKPPFIKSSILHIPHGFFSKHGGISRKPYDSLNVSITVGDDPSSVKKNRLVISQSLALKKLSAIHQVHGSSILVIDSARNKIKTEQLPHDAMITDLRGVGLLIQQADCQAILLYDPEKQVIAAIHNGWQGSVANITGKVVAVMEKRFSVNPQKIRAAISPSLGPCCAEFIHYKDELPSSFHAFQKTRNHFDFWEISRNQLQTAGVQPKNMEIVGICTACDHNFFSYRRTKTTGKITGRNCSVIALPW